MKVTSKFRFCLSLLGFFLILTNNTLIAQPGGEGIVIGKSFQITSKVFNEERTILVYTPEGYRNSDEKYPVLYLLDGYDHFHYVSGMVLSLARNGKIPNMIVVGIQNPNRNRDFTPRALPDVPNSGGGNKFIQFAKEELFPFIDKNYRTEPCRVLMGHSLCGMFAVYSLMKDPELFKGIIAASPAVYVDKAYLTDFIKKGLDNNDFGNFLYFTVGGNELPEDIKAIKDFENLLKESEPEGLKWSFEVLEDKGHHAVVFMSIYNGLQFIFADQVITDKLANEDADDIIDHFEKISGLYGYEIKVPEYLLNNAGYKHLREGNIYDAIKAFEENISRYPNSANAYNSLGEAYETNNQLQLAKENYEKAYRLASKAGDPNLYLFMQDYENILNKLR